MPRPSTEGGEACADLGSGGKAPVGGGIGLAGRLALPSGGGGGKGTDGGGAGGPRPTTGRPRSSAGREVLDFRLRG